jgi:hypothetical protein
MKQAKRKRSLAESAQSQYVVDAIPNQDFEAGQQSTAEAHPSAPGHVVDTTGPRRRKKRKKNKKKNSVLPSDGDQSNIKNKEIEAKQNTATEDPGIHANPPTLPSYPYETEPDDHCESPLQAYEHILPLLSALEKGSDARIYDPYFCNGAVKSNLSNLGFPNVYNVMEDCYSVWEKSRNLDFFDALVTNPPYSGDHVSNVIPRTTGPMTPSF